MAKKKPKPKAKKKKAARPRTKAKKPARKTVKSRSARPKPKAAKRRAKPAAPELPWRVPLSGEKLIGVVEDYYSHIGVITVTLKQPLKVGDRIHVRGHTTDISQGVASMQIDHAPVTEAGKGAALGIKIGGKCRRGDYIYKVS